MPLNPDTLICTLFKSRPLQITGFETYCTATRVMLNEICTWTVKTRAEAALHRDNFLGLPEAWYQDSARCLRRVTPTKTYRRAVVGNEIKILILRLLTTFDELEEIEIVL